MMLHHDDSLHPSYFSPTLPDPKLHLDGGGRKRKAEDSIEGEDGKARRRRNPWTVEQSNLLKAAVAAHGKTWSTIMQHFPVFADWGRSQMDLKDRWRAMVKSDASLAAMDGPPDVMDLPLHQHVTNHLLHHHHHQQQHHPANHDMHGSSIHMILTQPFNSIIDDTNLSMMLPKPVKEKVLIRKDGNNSRRKRSFWTEEQTELLKTAVAHVGKSWAQIERDYPQFRAWGRTQVDIKDRWRNIMKAERNAGIAAHAHAHAHAVNTGLRPHHDLSATLRNHHEPIPIVSPHVFDMHGLPDPHYAIRSPHRLHPTQMHSV